MASVLGRRPERGAAAPHVGSLQHMGPNPFTNPTRHHPLMACAFRPPWWGGARWGATSAWCALGGPRDLGSGLAAHEVARARKELPAGRWPRHRAPGLCGAAGSARHAGHCYPTVAGAQAFREKTFCKVKPTTNPATLMGWLGRVWVFDLIKGF